MKNLATPGKPPANATPPTGPLVPFVRGAIDHVEPFYDQTFTLTAASQNLGPYDIVSFGFARAIWLDVQVVSAGNSAAVTVLEDAPWSVLGEFAVQDLNGAPMFGPHSGYEVYLHHKYGGYRNQRDPKAYANSYSAPVTGAGATGGSFRFGVRINLNRSERDGLASLANMNSSQSYKIRGSIAPLSQIYGVNPTVAPTVRVRAWLEAYSQPNSVDAAGRNQATVPPANMTTGYSSRIQSAVNAGANTIRHTRVGNYVRNLIYVLRRGGTSRVNGEADLANVTHQWYLDSRLLTSMTTEGIRARMVEQFDLMSQTAEAASGPDNGVLVLPFCTEFDGKAGYEMRDFWLPTTQATRLELVTTLANAGVLTIMTDDVAPKGNVFMS